MKGENNEFIRFCFEHGLVWTLVFSQNTSRKKYKHWVSIPDIKRCLPCAKNHGKIWIAEEAPIKNYELHPNCRCIIEWMDVILAGTASICGEEGADWHLKNYGRLPDYYISKEEADKKGFRSIFGNLSLVAPGKTLAKGVYQNRNKHLPSKQGRIWYEADINYVAGYRGSDRILYSNDGLIFVTYDHYRTFYPIG